MTIYYVSTTGTNTNLGTLTSPWKTLKHAESQLVSGDTVYVRGGIYQEYFTINVPSVTFQNYADEFPIVDGIHVTPNISQYVTILMIKANGVTIDGLTIRNSACYGTYIDNVDNVTIKNVEVYETYRQCLVVKGANNAVIQDCEFHHGAKVFILWDQNVSRQDPPIITVKYSNGVIFNRTKIHDSYNEGINIGVNSRNTIVEYCEIYGNPKSQLYLCASTNNMIRYNLIYGTNHGKGQGIYFSHEDQWVAVAGNPVVSNSKVYGNLVTNTSNNVWIGGNVDRQVTNVQIYNNVLVEATGYGFRVEGGTGDGHSFKNNIIWQTSEQIANIPRGKVNCDYNLWSRTPDVDAQGPNDPPYAEPKLAKTIGWNDLVGKELKPEDFMLQPDSPAIDKGVYIENMTHDFFGTPIPQGAAPDIGAIEYTDISDLCLYTKIIDNGDAETSSIGEWLVSGGTNPYGVNSLYCRVEGSYTWETILPQMGVYDVNMWWTEWPSRTDAAKVEIYDGNVLVDTKFVNQLQNGGQWNLLSTINFQTTSAKVVIFSKGGEAAAPLSTTCADAVKFETIEPCENVCIGTDLYSQKCDPTTGNCINDQLLESNSETCGYVPPDLCEGVECPYICIGVDLYSQKCDPATGNCITDQLIESNSLTCGYDPCQGVVCENVCIGTDLYSQKCDPTTGNCITDQLIESNSEICGFDPCEGITCPNICVGDDFWSQKCINGECILDQLIQSNSEICGFDLCENVTCPDICVGTDLWSQKCDSNTGNCVLDQLLESNSLTCGFDPCEGITCPNICMGTDFWSQKCVNGECILNQLLENNSEICGYDIEDPPCPNVCVGTDLYSQKRVDGECVTDQLIESNSVNCLVPTDDDTITKYLVFGGLGLIGYMMLMKDKE